MKFDAPEITSPDGIFCLTVIEVKYRRASQREQHGTLAADERRTPTDYAHSLHGAPRIAASPVTKMAHRTQA